MSFTFSLKQLVRARVSSQLCTRHIATSTATFCAPLGDRERFEPPYLNETEPQVAVYPLVNIQMKGYDYTVLQSYQSWVGKTVSNMGINITDRYASPCSNLEVSRLKKKSDIVEDKYHFNIYERTIQVSQLPAPLTSVLCEVLQAALPEGVELCLDNHEEHHETIRFVPDLELKELRQQVDELGGPTLPPTRKKK